MQTKRSTFALVIVSVAVGVALAASPTASARTQLTTRAADVTTATYTDATGDSKSAPDIGNVLVSLDSGSGIVGFGIQLANNDDLSNGGAVLVEIDTDRNAATGNSVGAEYAVIVGQNGYAFLKWDGNQMSPFAHQPAVVGLSNGVLAIALCSCDLGTQSFNFAIGTIRGNDIDVAPDNGIWAFPQQTTSQITFQSVLVSPKPLFPKAGKRFTVSVMGAKLGTGEIVQVDSSSCTATLAGHALHGSGTGGCTWTLPKKAKGKKLVVDVTVSYQGASDTFGATYTVP
jgi:hypothetical protein